MKNIILGLLVLIAMPSFAGELEDQVIRIFSPYVQKAGLTGIRIVRSEDLPEYTGGVDINNGYLEIMFGSEFELQYPGLTQDGYSAIICHELGHFFAGAPKRPGNTWASSESMSDYFSTAVCLKKLFRSMGALPVKVVDPVVLKNCDKNFSTESERNVCYRTAEAGLNLMKELHLSISKIGGFNIPFYDHYDLSKKDPGFYGDYPSLQCRAETLVAGAFCSTSEADWESGVPWACQSGVSARPSCWFRP